MIEKASMYRVVCDESRCLASQQSGETYTWADADTTEDEP